MDRYDFFLGELDQHIRRFQSESTRHKRQHRRLRYAVFGLTALATVLASWATAYPRAQASLSLAIVAATALAGIVTSIEGLRKPAELWMHERITYYALLDLKREVAFWAAEAIPPQMVESAFARMQALLGASAEKWNRQILGTKGAEGLKAP